MSRVVVVMKEGKGDVEFEQSVPDCDPEAPKPSDPLKFISSVELLQQIRPW